MGALGGIGGVILHSEGLALPLGVIGDRQLHRMQHRHGALGVGVQILAEAVLQKPYSTVLGDLATPMRSQKLRMDAAV